jgi:hypothetical protein
VEVTFRNESDFDKFISGSNITELEKNLLHSALKIAFLADKLEHPIPWTNDQREWLRCEKILKRWQGIRFFYLQKKQSGLIDTELEIDPVEILKTKTPFYFKEQVELYSDYYFAKLQVLIHGWKLIKKAAAENFRYFQFSHPLDLLLNTIIVDYQDALDFTFSKDINQGITLTDVRKSIKQRTAFLRERLEKTEEEKWLHAYQNGDWNGFWVYAIWEHKHNKKENNELCHAWKNFLKADKKLSAWFCNTDTNHTIRRWNNGNCVSSQNGKPYLQTVDIPMPSLAFPNINLNYLISFYAA